MSTRTAVDVILYERPGCCLCAEMLEVVEAFRSEYLLNIVCVDISRDAALEASFGQEIPVLFIGGRKAFKYRVSGGALRRRLEREVARQR
jgi:hypothetical protein